MNVLVACEFSGIVREAFAAQGHCVLSADLLETEKPGAHFKGNVLDIIETISEEEQWDLMIAFPPCTHLAVSGARWFPAKRVDGRQQAAINFFMQLAEAPIPRIAIENPVSIMSTEYRKPDQIVHPWMFGTPETKATCLWLKNLPPLVPTDIVDGRTPRTHRGPPHPDRWKRRSRTCEGLARAMAHQWNF